VREVLDRWHADTARQAYSRSGDELARPATSAQKCRSGSPASSWIIVNAVRSSRERYLPMVLGRFGSVEAGRLQLHSPVVVDLW
jgi:hypothetical protein